MESTKASISIEFMTTKQAAKFLLLSPRTLEAYRLNGTGPPYRKHSSRPVYEFKDLLEWSESRRLPREIPLPG